MYVLIFYLDIKQIYVLISASFFEIWLSHSLSSASSQGAKGVIFSS